MLPAHYYPELKKYDHLIGNYGNTWWQQKTEFKSFNGSGVHDRRGRFSELQTHRRECGRQKRLHSGDRVREEMFSACRARERIDCRRLCIQKAVIVLLALLFLGVKNIHIGSTLSTFLSPNVAKLLVENFGIAGIGSVDDDMKLLVG